jgi:hypothetical protein
MALHLASQLAVGPDRRLALTPTRARTRYRAPPPHKISRRTQAHREVGTRRPAPSAVTRVSHRCRLPACGTSDGARAFPSARERPSGSRIRSAGSALRAAVLDRFADVALKRFDRAGILSHVPAEALASTATYIGVRQDRCQRPTQSMLTRDVRTQPRLTKRPPSENEIGIPTQAWPTTIRQRNSRRRLGPPQWAATQEATAESSEDRSTILPRVGPDRRRTRRRRRCTPRRGPMRRLLVCLP